MPENSWLPTNAVAWYGAIVATGSLILGFLNFRRDRTRLRVKADTNTHTTEHDGPQIVITVANIGRRPVHLQTLPYFTAKGMGNSGYMVKGQWHPSGTLQEGQSAVYFCNQEGVDLSKLRKVVVRDETGRKWKGRINRN